MPMELTLPLGQIVDFIKQLNKAAARALAPHCREAPPAAIRPHEEVPRVRRRLRRQAEKASEGGRAVRRRSKRRSGRLRAPNKTL
jgi:hypothetical protein